VKVVVGTGETATLPVPVTVKVYVPAVVPEVPVEPVLPLPQAVRLPSAVINTRMPSMERQLRRRAGIPRKTRKASIAPPPAPAQPLPGSFGTASDAVAAVVLTVTVAVPLVVVELSVTVLLPLEQLGRYVAPEGYDVNAHVSVTVPA
jgi:hypothetical protein